MATRKQGIVMEPTVAPEAPGVLIRRTVGAERMIMLDPVLLLDHLTLDAEKVEGGAIGFPRHPHRGIETLTVVLAGRVHHKDSLGNDSSVTDMSAQWMVAGRGIFHEEYFAASDQGCEAIQLWFNLPAAHKTKPAGYTPASHLPVVEAENGSRFTLIAGQVLGMVGPIDGIAVSPLCLLADIPAGGSATLPSREGDTAFVYVINGRLSADANGAEPIGEAHLVVYTSGGDISVSAAPGESLRLLYVSAPALKEPVMQYRSLVMNTVDEMTQALRDLEQGTFA